MGEKLTSEREAFEFCYIRANEVGILHRDDDGEYTSLFTKTAWALWQERTRLEPKPYRACGGCGNADPEKRCVNCGHDFQPAQAVDVDAVRAVIEQTREYYERTDDRRTAYALENVLSDIYETLTAALTRNTQEH